MKVVGSRFLRGPNIFQAAPCVLALLDLRAADGAVDAITPGLVERVTLLLAGSNGSADGVGRSAVLADWASSDRDGDLAELTARLVATVQRLAGGDAGATAAVALPPQASDLPHERHIVFGYTFEAVAAASLVTAVRLLTSALRAAAFDLDPHLAKLRALVAARAVDPASAALLHGARQRGVPVLPLDEAQRTFQLGWGIRQRRHQAASPEAPATGQAVPELDALFPTGEDGRIPLVAITGTNGKTTTTQLIAHAMRATGVCVGTTTTQGVFIGDACIQQGDCTGYWSARSVLTHPAVQVAVLETARGGILKRGLAFDRCDVGVVLNVSGDHLGLDGVDTLDDLAHVKGLIARMASRAAVLNAEDPRCVAMRHSLRAGCDVVFFSMDETHPVLRAHLAAGGKGAWLSGDGWLTWLDAGVTTRLVEARTLPFTLDGHARYNIANALAAVAALACMGHVPMAAAQSLTQFLSDAQSNPLRANTFDVQGVRVILDYAHNVAAYQALCDATRSMLDGRAANANADNSAAQGGRLIGVITAPGDRRSDDLHAIGQVCGKGFDELVVYEQDPRGRHAGGTTQAILGGAESAARGKPLHAVLPIREALASGLQRARSGDILVFTCAGTLDDFVAGVAMVDTHSADAIAASLRPRSAESQETTHTDA